LLPFIVTGTSLGFKLISPEADFAVNPFSLALAAVVGLVAAFASAAVPAWRSARVSVAETVRRRGMGQTSVGSRAPWSARVVVVTGVAIALSYQALTTSPVGGLVATALITIAALLLVRPLVPLLSRPL